ncbi:MAG: helix-turn-helix transcriptional regulator [Methyloceanibacter sp.]|uniref:helix-turn-helix transcriptional regulator n=1 Tax=Methyloceanibacter sp. TaxID=1965321 RepID=UPI003D9B0342
MKREVPQKFITRRQLQQRWSVSHMFVERKLMLDPTFPKPIRLADGKIAHRYWNLDEIEAWERGRVAKLA